MKTYSHQYTKLRHSMLTVVTFEAVQCVRTMGDPLHATTISSGLSLCTTASPQLPSHLGVERRGGGRRAGR